MTRLIFLFTWLHGPRVFSRFILLYVLGMLLLFYCMIGGLQHIPASPAHAVKSPYPAMPKPIPVPPNTAEVMRKRMNNGPRMLNVPAPETAAKPVPSE
jgi:hypothetical protein